MGVTITFDSVSSNTVGVTVEGYHSAPLAEKSVESIPIHGRNGNLLIDNRSFLNYKQKYVMHWRKTNANRTSVINWLYKEGYKKFEDSSDANHFRMACFIGGVPVDSRMDVLDRAEFEFDFKPQRFLTSGDTETRVYSGNTVNNPTAFPAKPIIRVSGARNGAVLTINGKSISFVGDTTGSIDCETENAYGGALNSNIRCAEFPTLTAGANSVSWSGTISSVYITPRWWEI